ncbi:MAG: hypothetical protein GDA37_13560 [Ekhidna sp.]|nr:hypothetical protein [Ekhidna sp.]
MWIGFGICLRDEESIIGTAWLLSYFGDDEEGIEVGARFSNRKCTFAQSLRACYVEGSCFEAAHRCRRVST